MYNGPPLYVLAIGAPTNICSALKMRPDIATKIVVIWLGGKVTDSVDPKDFNLMQDEKA